MPENSEQLAQKDSSSNESERNQRLVCAATQPGADERNVYAELAALTEAMPARAREVFCFRWGLGGASPHLVRETAARFDHTRSATETMLERALWNATRQARCRASELSAISSVLGENDGHWAERAWEHADRWGNKESQLAEATLLLAVGGMEIAEARAELGQHMIELGVAKKSRWPVPLNAAQRRGAARVAVDRMLDHVMWPKRVTRHHDLGGFARQRALPSWAPSRSGLFRTTKPARAGALVQFESELELKMFGDLDLDSRIVCFQEQPLTIPYEIDAHPHDYTPDAIALLDDGRAFVIEAKSSAQLGEFNQVLKWASLARFCGLRGFGLFIGNPERSVIDEVALPADVDARDLILAEANRGIVDGDEYAALRSLVGDEQLGIVATSELLDWRTDRRWVRHARDEDRAEARRFWALVRKQRSLSAIGASRSTAGVATP